MEEDQIDAGTNEILEVPMWIVSLCPKVHEGISHRVTNECVDYDPELDDMRDPVFSHLC